MSARTSRACREPSVRARRANDVKELSEQYLDVGKRL
jgi:hypothetical protein